MIHYMIQKSNDWLRDNRRNYKPITMERVVKRIKTDDLLSIEADAKTTKGTKNGYLTGILYLAPADICGFNMCPPKACRNCKESCLFNAGRGRFSSVTEARMIKTIIYQCYRKEFTIMLEKSIDKLIRMAKAKGLKPAVRINGTSEIVVEKVFKSIIDKYYQVQFYDYTKLHSRFINALPDNYDLTYSYNGDNKDKCLELLSNGHNVAVVFSDELPSELWEYQVIDGDASDLRFLDTKGVVVGLKPKGRVTKNEFILGEVA